MIILNADEVLARLAPAGPLEKSCLNLSLRAGTKFAETHGGLYGVDSWRNRVDSAAASAVAVLKKLGYPTSDNTFKDMYAALQKPENQTLKELAQDITVLSFAAAKTDKDSMEPALSSVKATLERHSTEYMSALNIRAAQLAEACSPPLLHPDLNGRDVSLLASKEALLANPGLQKPGP